MIWNKFENRMVITAELVAETGLRIGAGGQSADPTASDLPVMKTPDGQPFIPGSSLRGVLRSHVERIVRAFEALGPGRGACSPTNTAEWCIKSDDIKRIREQLRNEPEKLAQEIFQKSCRVCRVFGSPWLASRVRIADLPCINGAQAETRDAVAIDREKETVANKYDFEAVPVGSKFALNIIAENLNELERGLLWLGIEELQRGQMLLGGFKSRGLGWVKLVNLRIHFVEGREELCNYLRTGEIPPLKLEGAHSWVGKLLHELAGGEK
jgi:CRISPR-associated RAMP protein (TIGR02581 family)